MLLKSLETIKYGTLYKININPTDYYEFYSTDKLHEWGNSFYFKWADSYVSKEEYNDYKSTPISIYAGYAYRSINDYKRGLVKEISDTYRNYANDSIPNAIISAPRTNKNLIVYRIMSGNIKDYFEKKNNYFEPLHELGFLSTSLIYDKISTNYSTAKDSDKLFLLKIYVPQNTEAVFVDAIGNRMDSAECELLINHNYYLYPLNYPYKHKGITCLECFLSKTKISNNFK